MQLAKLPITEIKLIYFCTHLATNNIAHNSILVYISGLSFHGTLHGSHFEATSMNILYLILRGNKRRQGNSLTRARRVPIILPMLLYLHMTGIWFGQRLPWHSSAYSDAEYTSPTAHQTSYDTLASSDISMLNGKMIINIRTSKTDQFWTIIRLFRLSSALCPVAAAQAYLHQRISGHFFVSKWHVSDKTMDIAFFLL